MFNKFYVIGQVQQSPTKWWQYLSLFVGKSPMNIDADSIVYPTKIQEHFIEIEYLYYIIILIIIFKYNIGIFQY